MRIGEISERLYQTYRDRYLNESTYVFLLNSEADSLPMEEWDNENFQSFTWEKEGLDYIVGDLMHIVDIRDDENMIVYTVNGGPKYPIYQDRDFEIKFNKNRGSIIFNDVPYFIFFRFLLTYKNTYKYDFPFTVFETSTSDFFQITQNMDQVDVYRKLDLIIGVFEYLRESQPYLPKGE